jgi:hypothetical protein
MTYQFTNGGGRVQTFNDREKYIQAYENQLRVQQLAENSTRRGYVTEEMLLPDNIVEAYYYDTQSSTEQDK